MKEQFINTVVRRMEPELEVSQLRRLKIVLTMSLSNLKVEEGCSDL